MALVLINWSDGENDPFTLFNQCLVQKLSAHGRKALIINLDSRFGENMSHALQLGVDCVITWQGLGSNLKATNSSAKSVWDMLQIPCICLHGDHPCHMSTNHSGLHEFVHHLYTAKSFSQYANQYIQRTSPAQMGVLPNFFDEQVSLPEKYAGDFFVLPKNYDDTTDTLKSWKSTYPEPIYHLLLEISETFKIEFNNGNHLNHHSIIEQQLTEYHFDVLKDFFHMDDDLSLRHHVHSIADKFYRNYISERVLVDLQDVRIKIYGRGWDRFKYMQNKYHEFLPFDKAADGNSQFHSNYGILDVAPINDSLHDRTLRAAANKNGFLIASSWHHENNLGQDFSNQFYSGRKYELREKVERIIKNPDAHRHLSTQFGRLYNQNFGFDRFLNQIDQLVISR